MIKLGDKRTRPTAANQAEEGTPRTSYYGQNMNAGMLSTYNDARYVPGPYAFRRFFGSGFQQPANVIPISHRFGYTGDVSLKYQPEIRKKKGFAS